MEKVRISTKSISISLLFHAVIIILFMLLNLSFDYEPSEYVELSFGVSDQTGSSGSQGKEITEKV
jgi:hypothetical protein